ncbi:NAD(P)-binding protein [Cutaneotrichosporon oleaginosum]|uniref:NAD(P)-binding protein n=1 Tax=Cutaneotrichosporon oleaginosum TaxID=879819 RepID=A0A0J0XXZ9_9TREE|nr:NAD(P)-binding protein [Cutaneotrichosporon oleaginosum]KLT45922.1 NAD(P)-binding protein [Cutaneotrichosporon oleaginosum]TXT06619.1 hypothetical protein COLE_05950 [Cutaneotrichosporon oleaginosum]
MTLPSINKRVVLAKRPERGPITPATFKKDSAPLKKPGDGEVVVKVELLSIDAAMRMWLVDTRSYIPPVQIGEVMRAAGLGRVVETRSDRYKVGDLVHGLLGWQEYWVGPARVLEPRPTPQGMQDIDHLGLLGVSGMTAYFGMFDVGRLKDGETVCISGAAGSVGLIATQIAVAHKRCKVIAIVGSQDKVDQLKALGCEIVLNYKQEGFAGRLRAAGRIDVYFDNVGGELLDLVLAQINPYARIVMCGAISQYNTAKPYGVRLTPQLISMKARMEGFIAFDYEKRYPEARAYLADLAKKDQLKYSYYVVGGGLDGCAPALQDMFSGKNFGKTVVSFQEGEHSTKL